MKLVASVNNKHVRAVQNEDNSRLQTRQLRVVQVEPHQIGDVVVVGVRLQHKGDDVALRDRHGVEIK